MERSPSIAELARSGRRRIAIPLKSRSAPAPRLPRHQKISLSCGGCPPALMYRFIIAANSIRKLLYDITINLFVKQKYRFMGTPHKPDILALLQQELAAGPRTGLDLERVLNISGPTLSRLLGRMGNQIERIGAARSARYGLRRPVRNLGDAWSLFVVGKDAQVRLLGRLSALHGAFRFLPASGGVSELLPPCVSESVSSGLPFFLMAARPGGFMGHHIARRFSERSGAPSDVRNWGDDDSLEYFIEAGTDLPGNLLVGETAKERAIHEMAAAHTGRSASLAQARTQYPGMIARAQEGETIGSSLDGEQPKFLATVDGGVAGSHRSLIVKFSPPV